LIDGVAYVKEPPAPSPIHQGIVAELCRQAGNALEDTLSRVFVGPFDVRLPKSNEQGDEVDTVVQPDVLIICDPLKTDSRGIRGVDSGDGPPARGGSLPGCSTRRGCRKDAATKRYVVERSPA